MKTVSKVEVILAVLLVVFINWIQSFTLGLVVAGLVYLTIISSRVLFDIFIDQENISVVMTAFLIAVTVIFAVKTERLQLVVASAMEGAEGKENE